QSLPPILDNVHQTPMSSCSKGSRGLSVQPRVLGIFTETTVSPDPSMRQRPSRCAIRAGRNLPDKEFRYLRTVIVTAAVYRGLVSRLRPEGLTSPLDLPSPGRRQPLYVVFRLRRDLCFWSTVAWAVSPRRPRARSAKDFPSTGAPLLPKLRGHFAEFLFEGSSDRLGILYLPTCVGFGTGTPQLPRRFSRRHGFWDFAPRSARHPVSVLPGGFAYRTTYAVTRGQPSPGIP